MLFYEGDPTPIMASLLTRDENAIRLLDKVVHNDELHKMESTLKNEVQIFPPL